MADSTVSGLTAKTTLAGTDILYLVQSPFGSGDDRKVTFANLVASALATPTLTGAVTLTGGTVNGTVLDISQTWGGTGTYTGIKYVVTDSGPANASSLLLDVQVAGSSKFAVRKDGNYLYLGTASPGTSNYTIYQDNTSLIFQPGSGTSSGCIHLAPNGAANWGLLACYATNSQVRIGSNGSFGFTSGPTTASLDVILTRSAAATLQLGAANAASPVAQTVQFQSSTSTNNTGADATFIASRSAGSGASGKIIFKGGVTGASSGTTNTSVAALTITSGTTNNTNVGYPSVVVGAGAAVATNATDGFLYIPTCAGTPTGTPTTQTGAAPLVVDSSNNKLYVYVGGAWTAMN